MLRTCGRFCAGGLIGAALLMQAPVLSAQEDADAVQQDAIIPVCMAGGFRDAPQTTELRRGKRFSVVVTKDEVADLEARGFTVADCALADLASTDRQQRWRDEICAMAATGNQAVQNQFERSLGARPSMLCAAAQRLAGPWQGIVPATDAELLLDKATG